MVIIGLFFTGQVTGRIGLFQAQAKLESRLDPTARAGTSSAAGRYQFTNDTWLRTLDRHGAAHGLDWAGEAIEGGRVFDPQLRSQVMALRMNPDASALMAAELAQDNRAELSGALGREPDSAELYLAHFLGSSDATRFLRALSADPGQSAVALLPKAAASNRTIFYESSGAQRSVGDVMGLIRNKVSAAMEGESGAWAVLDPAGTRTSPPTFSQFPPGSIAEQFQVARQSASGASRPSMADTLRDTFSIADASSEASAPDFVRAAYGQLQRFGL